MKDDIHILGHSRQQRLVQEKAMLNIPREEIERRRLEAQSRKRSRIDTMRARVNQIQRANLLSVLGSLSNHRPVTVLHREAVYCLVHEGVHYPAPVVVALAFVRSNFPDVDWDVSARDVIEAITDVPGMLMSAGLRVVACDCGCRRNRRRSGS